MSKKENLVDSSIWRHLPSDKTLREFRREYQQTTNREKEPSVTWVKGSLNQISKDNPIIENLFRKHDEDIDQHYTYPILIPMETAQLITTILETRDSNKKAKGEAYAAEILSNLAEHIVASLDRDISDDYVYLQYLSNENIRDKMMQKFKEQLLIRLNLLRDYIINPEAGMDIAMLQVALGRLDVLISIFDKKRPRLTSDTCALMDVYGNLIAKREETIPAKGREQGANYYQELSEIYPELESNGFKDIYLKKVCNIFSDANRDFLMLKVEEIEIGGIPCEKDSLPPGKRYEKLFAASNILRIACKYIVAVEIEKAVPQLVDRYCDLRRRIKE